MDKTYALFDLVGISDAIKKGGASDLLERFWSAADAWTNSASFELVAIPGTNCVKDPDVYVSTFSDSALMHTGEELGIDDFFRLVLDLKQHIERQACGCYVIVSRNKEIQQPRHPALGANLIGSDNLPRYIKLAGSGVAWVSLHAADKVVQEQKTWHKRYSVYCIGELARPTTIEPKESMECIVLGVAERVYALK